MKKNPNSHYALVLCDDFQKCAIEGEELRFTFKFWKTFEVRMPKELNTTAYILELRFAEVRRTLSDGQFCVMAKVMESW